MAAEVASFDAAMPQARHEHRGGDDEDQPFFRAHELASLLNLRRLTSHLLPSLRFTNASTSAWKSVAPFYYLGRLGRREIVYQELGASVLIFPLSFRMICRQMQKGARRYLAWAMFAALTSGGFCFGKDDTASPESLFDRARKLENLWSDGTPSVKVRTEIKIFDAKGKITPGQYVVTWISPLRWMEELEIANYKRLRVHNAKGYWQQSTVSFQPEIIFQLDSMLDFKTVLKIRAKRSLGKVKTRDKDGVRQKCTEVKWVAGTERVLCFDEDNGSLLSVEYPRSENQTPPDISRVEYSAFNKLGDKRIPYEVHAFRDRTTLVTAKVTDVTPITEVDPAPFTPPTNSEF